MTVPFPNYQRVIVHCGLHKTGTSYIQQLCTENRLILSRNGIHYPEFRSNEAALNHKGNLSIVAVSYNPAKTAEENLSAFVDLGSECETLILSAEEFPRVPDVRSFVSGLKNMAPNAKIEFIFYLRRFDHMIESVYGEMVKTSLVGGIGRALYQLDYGEIVRPFIREAGLSNVTVRPYNKRLWAGGSIARDFFSTIGHSSIPDDMETKARANVALSRQETFLLSLLRTRNAKARMFSRLLENPLSANGDRSRYFRAPEERLRLNAVHAPRNQILLNALDLGPIDEFLGLYDTDDDPDWCPFKPDWPAVSERLAKFSEELADAL